MIFVIRPLGEGALARWTWLLRAGLYTFGLLTTSAMIGSLLGYIGALLSSFHIQVPIWVSGVVAFAYALKELGIVPLPMLQRRWQVPIGWVQRYPFAGPWLYGTIIGTGVLTYITYPGFYVWTGLAVIMAAPSFGALLGLAYGLGRVLPVLLPGLVRHDGQSDPFIVFGSYILTKGGQWHRISAGLLLVAGAVLVWISP